MDINENDEMTNDAFDLLPELPEELQEEVVEEVNDTDDSE